MGRPSIAIVDGVAVMAYYKSSAHAASDGALHIRFSDDYGATWTDEDTDLDGDPVTGFPMNPPDCAEGQDGNEPHLYLAPNGNLVLHMWRAAWSPEDFDGSYQSVSTDGGLTWSEAAPTVIAGVTDASRTFTTDDHFVVDGVIYAAFTQKLSGNISMCFMKSTDNGANWTMIGTISDSSLANEAGVEYLGDSRIIAILRGNSNDKSFRSFSEDMGETWSEPEDITADILASGRQRIWTKTHFEGGANWEDDPRLIMTGFVFGSRQNSLWFSTDAGLTWTYPRFLDAAYEDGGYSWAFYNPTNGHYIVVSYRGAFAAARLVQYDVSVSW